MSEADPGIDALDDAWREAFRRRDVDAILGLLTPDSVLGAPAARPIMTRQQRVFVVLRRAPDGVWRFARGTAQPGPAA